MDEDTRVKGLLILGVGIIVTSVILGFAGAQQTWVSLPISVDLNIGEYVADSNSQCFILFTKSIWRVKPDGHPIFGDYCQYGSFKMANYRPGSMISNEIYEIEVCDDGYFFFCENRVDVSFYNDTSVELTITPN